MNSEDIVALHLREEGVSTWVSKRRTHTCPATAKAKDQDMGQQHVR